MPVNIQHEVVARLHQSGQRLQTERNGQVMHWRGFGAGTPLVLIHGGHGSWLHWARNIEALAASHRVLVPDLPGFGESDAMPPATTLADFVDTIAASLDQLVGAGTPIGLVGFSFGAIVAAELASRRAALTRLALLGPVGHGTPRRPHPALRNWRLSADGPPMLADLSHNLSAFMLHGPVDPLALEIHRYSCVHTRYRSKETAQTAVLAQALQKLDLPLLILWGEHDTTGVPAHVGPMLQDGRANREWAAIPSCGHWVQFEAAEEVNRRLAAWFE